MKKQQIKILAISIIFVTIVGLLVGLEILPTDSIIYSSIITSTALVILIRKYQKNNIKEEKLELTTNEKYSKLKPLIIITRVFSLVPVILTIIILSDIFLPASIVDEAVIFNKNITKSRDGNSYYLYGEGKYKYSESVELDFFDKVQVGDTIQIHLSKNFMEWKKVDLIKNNTIIFTTQGSDIYYMGIFSLAFLFPIISVLDPSKWLKKFYFWIPSSILIILSIVFWILLILKWTGAIEKF